MIMKIKSFIFLGLLCLSFSLVAQNEVDVLRYSMLDWHGISGRSAGMAGSFGALGADLSSMSINPAGIGLYRRSDFGISLGVSGMNATATYQDQQNRNLALDAGIHSIGYVSSNPINHPDWERVNFGVGFNRLASFKEEITIKGSLGDQTLLNQFVNQVSGSAWDEINQAFPYDAALAWETFLINPADTLDNGNYNHVITGGGVDQEQVIERSGSLAETVVSGGANYRNRLYFGASLAFPRINYQEKSTYRETTIDDQQELDHFIFAEEYTVNGRGFNLKGGVIFRATDWLRIGVSGQTPTWFSLTESFSREMTAVFKGESPYRESTDIIANYYKVRTPMRLTGSMSFVMGKAGVINADYEYLDYSTGELGNTRNVLSNYDYSVENLTVATIYRPTHNVRVGSEIRITKPFRIRAGIGYQQSPFAEGVTTSNGNIITYAGGVGYRGKYFYADVSYTHKTETADYFIFNPENTSGSKIDTTTGQVLLSCGFRF
ncbi:MAG: hypothetical protein ACI9RU_001684 [Litorivivens sp.]|jgi:hypothetical protein